MSGGSVEPGLMLARYEANGTVTESELARLSRAAQKAFIARRLKADLQESRRLESKIDALLYSPLPPALTPTLFQELET